MTEAIRKFISILALMFVAVVSNAQYTHYGDDPFGLDWMQVEGAHFSVIYPEGYDSLAYRYLNLFENTRSEALRSLGIESERVPIVLHPFSLTNKTQVSWAPKRIDISTTPNQNIFAVNWDVSQAVIQNRLNGDMAFFTKGDFLPFKILVGEQSTALGIGFHPDGSSNLGEAMLQLSDWFKGGPTSNSKTFNYLRAAFLTGDVRTRDHWKYGSYLLYTPKKEYQELLQHGAMRRYSGNMEYFSFTMNYVTDHFWSFFSKWNIAYKSPVGKTRRKVWRQEMVPRLTELWSGDIYNRGEFTQSKELVDKWSRRYTEFSDFHSVSGELFATRTGMEYEKQLVTITDGRVKRVLPFAENSSSLSSAAGKLYWSEIVPDLRWSARQYSIIRSFDPTTGIIRDITAHSRYFNPQAISDGRIVAVEYLTNANSAVVMLDDSGEKIWSKELPSDMEAKEAILIDGKIYFTAIMLDGCGLFSVEPARDNIIATEIPPQSQTIEDLNLCEIGEESFLTFISDYDDVMNVYSYDVVSGTIKRLTNSRFGAMSHNIIDDKLIFGDFDTMGAHPVSADIDNLQDNIVNFAAPAHHILKEFFDQDAAPLDSTAVNATGQQSKTLVPTDLFGAQDYTFDPHPYNILDNIHLHSWAPFYASVDRITDMSYDRYYQLISPGATLLFQNSKGNFTAQVGYSAHREHYFFENYISDELWSRNKWFHSGHINLAYSGLYPVIELNFDFNDRYRREFMVSSDYYGNPSFEISEASSPAMDGSIRSYVPLNFSKGGWNRGLVPYAEFNISNDYYAFNTSSYYTMQHSVVAGARFYNVTETPKSRLFPRLGFGVDASYSLYNGVNDKYGNLVKVYAYGYLPGLTNVQGFKLTATVQHYLNYDENLYVWDNAKAPRGYKGMHLGNYAKATVDYAIPIGLGDVTWPWLYYFKRLQFVPFFDIAYNITPGVAILKDAKYYQQNMMYSYGADALINAHILRTGSELSFGVRYARTAEGTNYFGLLFSTGLKEKFNPKR